MKTTFYKNLVLYGLILLLISNTGIATAQTQALASNTIPERSWQEDQSSKQLEQVIEQLQQKYNASFLYEKKYVKDQKVKVELNFDKALEYNLKKILANSSLTYEKIDDQTYVILTLEEKEKSIKKVEQQSVENKPSADSRTTNLALLASLSAITSEMEEKVVEQTISGKVIDSENQTALPGVNVLVQGTTVGTVTDIDGNYTITAPDDAEILVFSSVGYTTEEVQIQGRSVINMELLLDIQSLSEVVVTALGIKKEAKKLGYATSTVAPDQIAVNRTTNFMNALQGKVPGVNITQLGTGPAGTSKIRIRGQSSFGGQNQPLVVVNGVPIDNTNFGATTGQSGSDAANTDRGRNRTSDGGDGLTSINPDDIESMTVLRGAAASALYGARAKDGVIMITTKQRGEGKGIGVQYNSNFTIDTPLDFTDYQYEYGQGENGIRPTDPNPTSGVWSFGEKFEPGMTQVLFDGIQVPYVPQPSHVGEFYRTGQTFSNTVTLSSGGEFGGFSLSLSNTDNESIVPNSNYNRKTINLGFTQEIAKKLNVSGNVNYSNEDYKNPPQIAEQDMSTPTTIYSLANSMPLDLLKENMEDADGNEFVYSRFRNRTNPYWAAYKRFDNVNRDRLFGNLTARYNFTDWLYLQGRVGQDYYARDQDYNFPTGTASLGNAQEGFVNGQFVQDVRRFREINTDFLIGANRTFGVIGVDLTFGGNRMYRRMDRNNVVVDDFVVRDLYTVMNGRVKDPIYEISERQVNSLYGMAELSFKEFLYLNGTVRNDWFSTLSPENRSILYPSVTGSFVFSQAFTNFPNWITFGKLRAGYAEVGSDTDVQPYASNLFYSVNNNLFPNPNGQLQPVGIINASTVPNADLRPMRVSETEVGLELRFLDNRVGFDITYYDKLTTDQILAAQVSDASGYTNQLINVGESVNRGVEMLFTITPTQTNNFQWDLSFNGSYNSSEVLKLGVNPEDTIITVGTGQFDGELRQVVGQPLGQLYGFGYLRDDQGRQVFDPGSGRPLRTPLQIGYGTAIPKWVGGITNTFNYKGVNLSFLVDFKLGHKLISGTNFNAWRHGLHKGTLVGREQGFVVGEGVNPSGEINEAQSPVQAYYETVRSLRIQEEFVYNAGFWKLRQVTLGYDFTRHLPDNFFIEGLKLSFVANNVAIFKKWVDNIDPEQFGFSTDNLIGLEAPGLPTTRSMGFNLNVKF